ncbi:MAG: STAS domain-containing protein [Hyphomicrobiales bacterium]
MSRVLKIEDDMDAATMADMREIFDKLADTQENVELDMKGVEFIDSSGVGGLVFLYKRLLSSGFKLTIHNISGQPLRLLTHLRMQGLIASNQEGVAA